MRILIVNGIKTPYPNTGRVFSSLTTVNHSGRKTRGKGSLLANFVGTFSEDPLKPSLFDLYGESISKGHVTGEKRCTGVLACDRVLDIKRSPYGVEDGGKGV